MTPLLGSLLAPGAVRAVRQPIVRIRDGSVVGWESLARFDGAGLSPLEALEVAEREGQRVDLELACLWAALADGPAPGGALLFLNTSPQLLLDPRFEALVPQLPPHVLEITENEPVEDYAPLRDRLQTWRRQGSLIAIDDVGAGYSTMAHVVRLSPAFLKIDRSLVAGVHIDREQRALVAALAAFAAQVGASCVAEGVELAAELEALADIGVDLVQGYLIARPGDGWPEPAPSLRRSGSVPRQAEPSKPFARMTTALETATTLESAADAVCRYLFEHRRLVPSAYFQRAGRLRCLARRGQWHVLDGLPSGGGITGQAFAADDEVLVPDVARHQGYLAAIPGVRAEMALPLRVDGTIIGVLNVDCLTVITEADIDALRSCTQLLGERLAVIGTGFEQTTPLQELSRLARRTSMQQPIPVIGQRAVEAAISMSMLDTAALYLVRPGGMELCAVSGEQAEVLGRLREDEMAAINTMVDGVASVHTGGGAPDVAFGPIGALRDQGVRAAVAVPVRDEIRQRGFLLATSSGTAIVPGAAVEALELVGLHVGATLAAHTQLEQVQALAFRDQLTGVANRTRFEKALHLDHVEPARTWLALLDVDRFKQINDRRGHSAGDDALRSIAMVLRSSVRDRDEVFRIGGDEFAVLLTGADEAEARAVVERVVLGCADELEPLGAGISVGLSSFEGWEPEDVFARADHDLYRCKAGKVS